MRNPFKREEKLPEFVPSTDPAVQSLKRATGTDLHHAIEAEVARTLRVVAGWDIWSSQPRAEIRSQILAVANYRDPDFIRLREGRARQSRIKRSPAGKDNQNE